jgi:hypothetical protein
MKLFVATLCTLISVNSFALGVGDYAKYAFKGVKSNQSEIQEYSILAEITHVDLDLKLYRVEQSHAKIPNDYVVVSSTWVKAENLNPAKKFGALYMRTCRSDQGGSVIPTESINGDFIDSCRTPYKRQNVVPQIPEGFHAYVETHYFGNFPLFGVAKIEGRNPMVFNLKLIESNIL